MVEQINSLHCKIIAISYLREEQRQNAKGMWETRFHSNDAFWIDAECEDNAIAVSQKVIAAVQKSGLTNLAGKPLLLAAFLDVDQATSQTAVENVLATANFLRQNLGCTIPLTIEFGYLGKIAFADRAALKERIKKVSGINYANPNFRIQLCLVADSVLLRKEEEKNWKAVMLLLDVLRRSTTPEMLLPVAGQAGNPNDDVGFLRYGEYDIEKYTQLKQEKTSLERLLSAEGSDDIEEYLKNRSNSIEEAIKARYRIDNPTCMPISAELICDPPHSGIGRMIHGNSARERYNSAFSRLRNQIDATAKRMAAEIREVYPFDTENIQKELDIMLKECRVGIELLERRSTMESLLNAPKSKHIEPTIPMRQYDYSTGEKVQAELSDMIANFLRDVRSYWIERTIESFHNALKDAYLSLDNAYFSSQQNKITAELENNRIQMDRLTSKEAFVDILSNGRALPNTNFFPVRAGGASFNFATCRTQDDSTFLDSNVFNSNIRLYQISDRYGNLKTVDTAPLKAVQLLMFDCDDNRLEELIG